MPTKTTYAEEWQQLAHRLKREACELLQWTEDAYTAYQYETGLQYLKWAFPFHAEARYQLERSRIFWNWWKHTWSMYDESLFSFKRSLKESSVQTIREAYEDLHSPSVMVKEKLMPNTVVLSEIKSNKVI